MQEQTHSFFPLKIFFPSLSSYLCTDGEWKRNVANCNTKKCEFLIEDFLIFEAILELQCAFRVYLVTELETLNKNRKYKSIK